MVFHRRRILGWAFTGVVALGAALASLPLAAAEPGASLTPPDPLERSRALLNTYCISCHGAEKPKAGLDLGKVHADPASGADREAWEKVHMAVERHEMPPSKREQPPAEERQWFLDWIRGGFEKADAAMPPNPGAVTLRRLNRNEYRNTVRDLVGVDYDTTREFPHDESGYGFDNIGDVLSLPPMLFEKYLAAAEEISRRVILTEDPARRRVQRIGANRFSTQAEAVSTVEEETWGFYREGEIVTEHVFERDGDYLLRVAAYGEQAGPELPRMAVRMDGRDLVVRPIKAVAEKPETFEVPVRVAAGSHKLSVAYLNNFNADGDRNLFLNRFEVVGPLGGPPEDYPEPHRRILPRRPERGGELAYAREVLTALATRAYRRPAADGEVERLCGLVSAALKEGESFERGIQWALQAVLVSPHFLFRWELDPDVLPADGIRDLSDWELASRLSYFLWSSMPDAALFEAAGRGELRRPGGLEAQVRRMLKDPKARELVRQFGGQWLQVRNLDEVEPDRTVFPGWNAELKEAMRQETEGFLWAVVQEDRSVRDFLDADFTYLNGMLARHYGIPGVDGPEFRKVQLPPGSPRGGILTLGSVLTVTSVPTRTAPVIRGKWILEQVLGTPPPPPPPNVPPIEEGSEASQSATLRQRLELHRSKPDCMVCHEKMDPLGFALENFDGIGAWRDKDGPHSVDTAGELPGGRRIEGAAGLKKVLRESDDFPRAFVSKLLTYALGRGLEPYDRRVVNAITGSAAKNDFQFSALVLEVVRSDPFQKRQTLVPRDEEHASIGR